MATHKTARGKQINMEAIRQAHGAVPAVGNMNVNARGDKIDSQGKIIKAHSEVIAEYYQANGMNVPKESGIAESSEHALAAEAATAGQLEKDVALDPAPVNANLEAAMKKSTELAEKIAAKRKNSTGE